MQIQKLRFNSFYEFKIGTSFFASVEEVSGGEGRRGSGVRNDSKAGELQALKTKIPFQCFLNPMT